MPSQEQTHRVEGLPAGDTQRFEYRPRLGRRSSYFLPALAKQKPRRREAGGASNRIRANAQSFARASQRRR